MEEVRRISIPHGEMAQGSAKAHPWSNALPRLLGPKAGRRTLEEAAALLKEKDPELFFTALLDFAGRQHRSGNTPSAAAIYQHIAASPQDLSRENFQVPPHLVTNAQQELAALTGHGSVGRRAEWLISQFAQQATDYRVIVPMLAGSAAFQLTKAATLGKLASSGAWLGRGLPARMIAGFSGFAVEVPTFSLLSRGLMDWSGEAVAWDRSALSKDLAGTALTLGALKSFAALGHRASGGISQVQAFGSAGRGPVVGRFSQATLPQASAFAGLLSAHAAEVKLGLRAPEAPDAVITHTLASLLSLSVGARLGRQVLGSRFAAGERELQWRSTVGPGPKIFSSLHPLQPRPAWALPLGFPRPMAMSGPEEFISWGRIRGNAETSAPAEPTTIPFRILVHRNNLFGGRVHSLAFQKPRQKFTLGSKSTPARDYKNLHDSPSGKLDSTMVSQRDGSLHMRHRVEAEARPVSDYLNLFHNESLPSQQASLEERNGTLTLRNLTRESLVWTLKGTKWQPVESQKEISLQDGAWIVLGKNPNNFPENTLDPRRHSVLRVEYFRPRSGPHRWNLIEFETRAPADLEKIPTLSVYLATLLGQSSDFVTWRFPKVFQALDKAGWQTPEAKDLLHRVFVESPLLAELNFGLLAQTLDTAHRQGWSPTQIRELLFQEALQGKNGMSFLTRLPKLLEEISNGQLSPTELNSLLSRMAKYEGNFYRALETLPDLLSGWRKSTGNKVPVQDLLDFLDRTQVSTEVLQKLFSALPGGEKQFLETMTRLIPQLQKEYGYSGQTLTELSAELLTRIAEHAAKPLPAPEPWVMETLQSLPSALKTLRGLQFGFMEQREILLRLGEEQGMNFSRWWRDVSPERNDLEKYLQASPKNSLIPGLTTLGLGFLGFHALDPELLRSFSPAFVLGASLFLPSSKPAGEMSLTFAWRQRLKIWFSQGSDKVRQLGELAHLMEKQGYLREARQRYEDAVQIAERKLAELRYRHPGNRSDAGEAHRSAGYAYYHLGGFRRRQLHPRAELITIYRKALGHLEPLGGKNDLDLRLSGNIQVRLHDLHIIEAEHQMSLGQHQRSGQHYEAAAELAWETKLHLHLLDQAARAYSRSDLPDLSDTARVNRKRKNILKR